MYYPSQTGQKDIYIYIYILVHDFIDETGGDAHFVSGHKTT